MHFTVADVLYESKHFTAIASLIPSAFHSSRRTMMVRTYDFTAIVILM